MEQYPPERFKRVDWNGQTFYLPRAGKNSVRILWGSIEFNLFIAIARAYVAHFKIKTVKALDCGPHKTPSILSRLRAEKAIYEVFVRPSSRVEKIGKKKIVVLLKNDGKIDWQRMGKKRSLAYIKAHVQNRGIVKSSELARGPKGNPGFYKILNDNDWLDEVFPYTKSAKITVNGKTFAIPLLRDGKLHLDALDKDTFVAYFNAMVTEHNISGRTELKNFGTLAHQMRKRKLTDLLMPRKTRSVERCGHVFILPTRGKMTLWSSVSREVRLDFCLAHCTEFDITRPSELAYGPHRIKGLYKVMAAKHELHLAFGAPERQYEVLDGNLYFLHIQTDGEIDWHQPSKQELHDYTRAFMRHYGITERHLLEKQYLTLFTALARRKLLSALFPISREVVTLCGRRFALPKKGQRVQWRQMEKELLNIYAACLRRTGTHLRHLPCQLTKYMNQQKVREYLRRLPVFDSDTAQRWRIKFGVVNNFDLPDEVLWAYGYEKYEDARIRAKCLRKVEPILEPL